MASPRTTPIAFGRLAGAILDFAAVGDTLPMHAHSEVDVHVAVVARGAFRCHGPGFDMTLEAGAVVDFKPGEAHEFVALVASARLVNFVKGGA